MNKQVKVSVVIPVYNAEEHLAETLECFICQTYKDIEIICVDDGSDDSSLSILQNYANKDERIIIIEQENLGAGVARNRGIEKATGKYVYFFDADDLCKNNLLEKTVKLAEEEQADIVGFDFHRMTPEGEIISCVGVHADWIDKNKKVFNYKDCTKHIMRVINPTPWNKLFNLEFIKKNNLRYEEISSTNDITFCSVALACAETITYIKEPLMTYRVGHAGTISSTKQKKQVNVIKAVESAVEQVKKFPNYEELKDACVEFVWSNYIFAYRNYSNNHEDDNLRDFYQYIQKRFKASEFEELTVEDFPNVVTYNYFCAIRDNDFEIMSQLRRKKVILSMTTFPARIKSVCTVLESIWAQTQQPDLLVLYLAEGQFPKKEKDLPEDLLALRETKPFEIHWCKEDIRPHKKYLYAMQEYAEDLIITIDDDLIYEKDMIESLFASYLHYPKAVSAVRTHVIVADNNENILPYSYWIKEADGCLGNQSMQLLATGGAGALYPPGLLPQEMLNIEAISKNCMNADDLWLKAMEVVAKVPVAVAAPYRVLKYVEGTQEVALYKQNVGKNENDVQLEKIIGWVEEKYGEGIFKRNLFHSSGYEALLGVECLSKFYELERIRTRAERRKVEARLQMTYAEKSEINRKLQITYKEKADRGIEIKELKAEKAKLERMIREKDATIKAREAEIAHIRDSVRHPAKYIAGKIKYKLRGNK